MSDTEYPTVWAYEQACAALEKLRAEFQRMENAWRDRVARLEDDSREHQECRRIFREGYLPPIPGESAALRGDALARLADILLDRKTQSDATGEAK